MVSMESAKTFPKMLPKPSSACFVLEARKANANSGRHVPIATTRPITNKGSPNWMLRSCELLVMMVPPTKSSTKLRRRIAVLAAKLRLPLRIFVASSGDLVFSIYKM